MMGRIDSTIAFDSLTHSDCSHIIDQITSKVNVTLDSWSDDNTKLILQLTEKAKEMLTKKGYSQEKGAREILRTYRKMVDTPLAHVLASNPDLFQFPDNQAIIE